MSNRVVLTGKIEIEVTDRMRYAAYEVLSKWYSDNSKATSGQSMLELSDDMLFAALSVAAHPKP